MGNLELRLPEQEVELVGAFASPKVIAYCVVNRVDPRTFLSLAPGEQRRAVKRIRLDKDRSVEVRYDRIERVAFIDIAP